MDFTLQLSSSRHKTGLRILLVLPPIDSESDNPPWIKNNCEFEAVVQNINVSKLLKRMAFFSRPTGKIPVKEKEQAEFSKDWQGCSKGFPEGSAIQFFYFLPPDGTASCTIN